MLRPNYIFQNPDRPEGRATGEEAESKQEKINPKLKQFYEVKTKIEPFYSGGKLSVLSACHFACQCGPTIKIISTTKSTPLGKEADDVIEVDEKAEELEGNDQDDKKEDKNEGFKVINTYECEMDEILSFDASCLPHVLLTAHKSNLLRLWDLNDTTQPPKPVKLIRSYHNTPIIHVAIESSQNISSRGENVTSVGELSTGENPFANVRWATVAGSVVKVWEMGGNQVSRAIKVDNIASIGFVKWGCHGKPRLYAAERKIYVIEMSDETKQYEVVSSCEGHFSQITGIEWSGENNNLMISVGRDNVMILWDMEITFNRLKTIQLPGSVESIILTSPSDLYLALSPSSVRYYNIPSQKLSTSSVLNLGKDETIISFHPSVQSESQGGEFWISTLASSVYKVNTKIGGDYPNLQISKQFVGTLDEIFAVALWSNMKVAVANNTSIIRVYSLESGSCSFLRGHTDIVLSLSVQKNWLISGSKDNRIIFWEEDSDEPKFTLAGHIASVTAVCFDPLRMIVYSAAEDTFIKAWDQTKCIQSVVAHAKEIHSVHCSPNGAMLLSASRDKTAKVWDSDTLTLIGTLKGHKKSVWDAKFSSWDQLVVTASADTTVKIWDIPGFNCIKTLQGHQSSVLQAVFINSGLQILSTSSDGTLKSWDIRTSTCISTYEQSDDKLWALDAVPDGSLIVTGSADSILTVCVDVTEAKYQESVEKKNKAVEEEQRLNNLLRKGDWQHAIRLAIELDRPFTLLKIIRDITDMNDLTFVISTLPEEHKFKLMTYIKRWNTNSRTSTEAQVLLNIFLMTTPPEELSYVDTNSVVPFTVRHFQRVQKNLQHIALVKYLAEKVVN
ncbi:unnamed protein product [Allacma fusca]|uniref:U3 small nucleolar RNA-associated protein 13 C-terminal domain-containing protein n=1 Tax=Allacma fusca TaxID=39272 RepID=A0A8J2LLL4_9HEXA|nr:unnamed protein product [Allacma fusca]